MFALPRGIARPYTTGIMNSEEHGSGEAAGRRPARVVVRIARRAVIAGLFVLAACLGSLGGVLFAYSNDLPQISSLDDYQPNTITRLLAADGSAVAQFATERRVVIGYEDMAPRLRQAIIAKEDAEFEQHFGLSITRIVVAGFRDVLHSASNGRLGRRGGASTITQQLARDMFLREYMRNGVFVRSGLEGLERKVKEWLVAIELVIALRFCFLDPRASVGAPFEIADSRCVKAFLFARHAEMLVDRLADVVGLRKPAAIVPSNHIAHFKARVLDRHGHAVIGARPAKRDEMPARLEHAQHFRPRFSLKGDVAAIPRLAHEALAGAFINARRTIGLGGRRVAGAKALHDRRQMVRRIAGARIHAVVGQLAQPLAHVANKDEGLSHQQP